MANGRSSRGMRLDQVLSRCGYCSRRDAAAWIRGGRVTIEGRPPEGPEERVDPRRVCVDGEPVESPDGLLVLLYKPLGVVCSRDPREGPSIYNLIPERWSRRNPAVTSVGRLDKNTSGLLLLTDVGELVHRWTSPRHHIEKTYEVVVDRPLPAELEGRFASGTLRLEGEEEPCRPARFERVGEREARLVLTEGRFHQVRRMFAAFDLTVVRLHRSRFGDYELGALAPGQWQRLEHP